MSEHTYEYNVAMSCSGCSNAVNRSLQKLEGVKNIDISLETQIVKVTTTTSSDDVLEQIKKTGKTVSYIGESSS